MTALLGTLLSGRYRLDAKIGAGGMSTVFRAFDTVLERDVAIKILNREIAHDSDQLERFRREARSVAQLSHRHVVTVIDAGEDGSHPYIVFEHVAGETLKERIRRLGRLPIDEAVAYAVEIARALGAAHACAIVHRDVKPQNVLIDEEGSAKVTDFGIARSLDDDGLTADGRVLGTTDYVSPEQALGHKVGPQSDLYSLGIVLFEMLTGEVPFRGENQVAVAMKHVREDLPDLRLRRPEASSALAAVLDRLTAKDLARRYANDAEVVADLEEVLAIEAQRAGHATGETTAVLRSLPKHARRRVPGRILHPARIFAVLAVLGVVAAAVIVLAVGNTERGAGKRSPAPPRELTEVSTPSNGVASFDPAPGDGTEHAEEARNVVDGNPSSVWSTERYRDDFTRVKPGVGIYLDARPRVAGRALELRTPTAGFEATIYAAEKGPPETLAGWQRISNAERVGRTTRFDLDTAGQAFRYYLVWITKLPEGSESARISELSLFR